MESNQPQSAQTEQLVRVLDYIQSLESLNVKPHFTVAAHKGFALYQHDIRGLPGISLNLADESSEAPIWFQIDRLLPTKPPAVPELLQGWVKVPNDPAACPVSVEQRLFNAENEIPPVLKEILEARGLLPIPVPAGSTPEVACAVDLCAGDLFEGDDESEEEEGEAPPYPLTVDIIEVPELGDALDAYVKDWQLWSTREQPRRKTIGIYDKLFGVIQKMELSGAEDPTELVWGCGMAVWNAQQKISYPLITQLIEAELDAKSMAIRVRPRQHKPQVELGVYNHLGNPGVSMIEAFANTFFGALTRDFSPFVLDTYESILHAAASNLDPQGVYWPHERKDSEDTSLPPAASSLRVTDTWVIFSRARSSNFILQDIKKLKTTIADGAVIPQSARMLVEEPIDEVISRPSIQYRGISSTLFGQIAGSGDSAGGEVKNLYFPKPFNDEQVSIIKRLESAPGVVVQGPPGTGKTHTISNVISHYLAHGKRVLVTSKGEPALSVLRDHIPESIRCLTISLLTSEKEGLKQLEAAVHRMAMEIERIQPARLQQEIGETEQRIDSLHQKLAAYDHELMDWARKQLTPPPFLGENCLPEEVARRVVENREQYAWLPDELGGAERFTPQFTEPDINALRSARKTLGEDILYLRHRLPPADELVTPETMERIHRGLARLSQISEEIDGQSPSGLEHISLDNVERAESLLTSIEEFQSLEKACASDWAMRIRQAYRRHRGADSDPVIAALESLLADISEIHQTRKALTGVAIELPLGGETDERLRDPVERASQGKRPFGWFGGGEVKNNFNIIQVNGEHPQNREEWGMVLSYIDLIREARRLAARWNTLAGEFEGPLVKSKGIEAVRSLSGHAAIVVKARRLATEVEKTVAENIGRLFPGFMAEAGHACDPDTIRQVASLLGRHLERIRLDASRAEVAVQQEKLAGKSGPVVEAMARFLDNDLGSESLTPEAAAGCWRAQLTELRRLAALRDCLQTVESVTGLIEACGAPRWAHHLRTEPAHPEHDAWLPGNWLEAWTLARLAGYIREIDGRGALKALGEAREQADKDLRRANERLVELLTWLKLYERMTNAAKSGLKAYIAAIAKIGTGTGVRAGRYRAEARRAMDRVYTAIPCWIMPHWRVSESLPSEIGVFDLVIIDEASQSDVWAVPSLLRGRKCLVVGDDKQVSPVVIGTKEEDIKHLGAKFLHDLPYGHFLLPGHSVYDLAAVIYAGDTVVLREHFRCVEPIIQFSNHLCYQGQIEPLRLPDASKRLDPPLIDVFVKGGYRQGKINKPEARAIVDEIKRLVDNPAFEGRTIGVVSLLGAEQPEYIQDLLINEIGEEKIIAHGIRCGDAMTFQGKEADIIFLSMVAVPDSVRAINGKMYEQRFNVAASRARDRMYLFRSVKREDLSDRDLRARLLDYFSNPAAYIQDSVHVKELRDLCESGFERSVFDALVSRGYRVTPQVKVGGYRIDLVVEGAEDRRLAIELDGDRYHTPAHWAEDMARQRVMERVGWRFWRCFGSSYILDQEGCLADLMDTLSKQGIEPIGSADSNSSAITEYREIDPLQEDVADEVEAGVLISDLLSSDSRETEPVDRDSPHPLDADRHRLDDAFVLKAIPSQEAMNFAGDPLSRSQSTPADEPMVRGKTVEIGDMVTYIDLQNGSEELIEITDEPTRRDREGRVNAATPFAQALLGSVMGEEVKVNLPGGTKRYKILDVVGNGD